MIRTVGHSTRSLSTLVELLRDSEISALVDVRTTPRSGRHPQFNRETLPTGLADAGIAYAHMPGLGGLRHARPDSTNTGWRNASFCGYADHMQTPEFEDTRGVVVEHIVGLGRREPHGMTSFARVDGTRVTYPSPDPEPLDLDFDGL